MLLVCFLFMFISTICNCNILLQVLTDTLSKALAPDALPCLAAEGDGGAQQGLQYGTLWSKYKFVT